MFKARVVPMRGLILIVLVMALAPPACRRAMRNVVPTCPVPAHWSHPVECGELHDLIIFKWNDVLYHGGQPGIEQFKTLKALGIRSVISTRRTRDDQRFAEAAGLRYFSVPMNACWIKEQDLVDFLRIATVPDNQPVFVYCWFGGDRSNMLGAVYRVVVQGWSREEALKEMTQGGHYFHAMLWNMTHRIRTMDVEKIRRLAGIETPHECSTRAASVGRATSRKAGR